MSTTVTVASHGSAVVFNKDVVKRAYDLTGTKLEKTVDDEPFVYIPIVNPESTTFVLDNILVDFEGGGDPNNVGAITEVQVAYGGQVIYNSSIDSPNELSRKTTSKFDLHVGSKYRVADSSSYGINVALKLYLRNHSSFAILHSVDLTFINDDKKT